MHLLRYITPGMDALDLIILGRQLRQIGERVLRGDDQAEERGSDPGEARPAAAAADARSRELTPGALLVMRDVLGHPGSSITDITSRTGLPQSYVSDSVGRLRALGMAETRADPSDGRRTLVQVPASRLESAGRPEHEAGRSGATERAGSPR
jgi:MarR family